MSDWSVAERAWGSHEPDPQAFESGSWSWDLRGDEIADIRFDGSLVLRMVRAVARDRDWNTVPTEVTAVRAGGPVVEIDLAMVGLGANITATITIEAAETLRLTVAGVSHTAFERNRLGFVVLHPPGVAGAPLVVVSPDGSRLEKTFPEHVSPHQPAFDIAALEWTADSVSSALAFEGDVFEMEDQRNWTDASYKTYSTPLSLPFPVALAAGHRFTQVLELTSRRVAPAPFLAHGPIRLEPAGRVPDVAVGAGTAGGAAPQFALPASAVLVEIETEQTVWPNALARAARSGLPLDLRIVTSDPDRIDDVLDAAAGIPLVRLGAFSADTHVTEPELWSRLRASADARGLDAELVAGTRAHFTELNRTSDRLPSDADAVTFSVTPQMHARERAQLVESIPMQAVIAKDAARIAGGRPLHIGPVTLRPRFNAVSTTPRVHGAQTLADGYGPALDPAATDERQSSVALAAWTIASFAALASAGVASITYFEEWGPRGLVDPAGNPHPVLEAIARLHHLRGQELLITRNSADHIFILGARTPQTTTVLAANLSSVERVVEFESDFTSGRLVIAPFAFSRHISSL